MEDSPPSPVWHGYGHVAPDPPSPWYGCQLNESLRRKRGGNLGDTGAEHPWREDALQSESGVPRALLDSYGCGLWRCLLNTWASEGQGIRDIRVRWGSRSGPSSSNIGRRHLHRFWRECNGCDRRSQWNVQAGTPRGVVFAVWPLTTVWRWELPVHRRNHPGENGVTCPSTSGLLRSLRTTTSGRRRREPCSPSPDLRCLRRDRWAPAVHKPCAAIVGDDEKVLTQRTLCLFLSILNRVQCYLPVAPRRIQHSNSFGPICLCALECRGSKRSIRSPRWTT